MPGGEDTALPPCGFAARSQARLRIHARFCLTWGYGIDSIAVELLVDVYGAED